MTYLSAERPGAMRKEATTKREHTRGFKLLFRAPEGVLGALIIRIGFCCPLYDKYNKEPPK